MRQGGSRETIPVRPGEELNLQHVERFLREHIADVPDAPLEVEQFPAGHSNLTYLLRSGDWEVVLRRPPLGPIAPKAHDMKRESWILSLVHQVYPLAPKPYLFCEDETILGAPFYVMERRKGMVLDREWPDGVAYSPELGQRISESVVETLVALHEIDWQAAGLGSLGRPEGFMERQVHGWIGRYERSKTDEIPVVEETAKWMLEHLPESPPATIVHNDYKLNNLILSTVDAAQVVAVVDWEMTTIGDPLSDVAITVSYWDEVEDAEQLRSGLTSVTSLPGFFSRRELLERYASKSGRDLTEIDFYLTYAYYKVAVICQQIYYRWKMGQTMDPRFERLGKVAENVMHQAHQIAMHGF
ncbi:phosphotransferase family protein [Brevibacillus humidisoli]|uniref:phosphotransferase family protein n=1 Tax=Brevibacillus humidisoli TaxID=2895522 RepID=UPI001E303091|nr:phosphotransferase family protein [Brevibacillus humidisoli]UFJ43025.1 phosphotransferase family protein [Brevibacillus humidisoli]